MNILSEQEREKLLTRHKKERDGRIRDRIKAVLLYDLGWSIAKIAKAVFLTEEAVRKQIRDYKTAQKLKPENGGSSEKLSEEQSKELSSHLESHTYLYVKDIVEYVKLTYVVSYTIHGLRNWLERHNFTYKKPTLVPGKANKEAQEAWIEEYKELKENLPAEETICFMDGVHPTHNVNLTYGWIKKGVRKELPANSGRSRLNLSGAVDILTHQVIIQEDTTLNGESTIEFLKAIEKSYPKKQKIHVFCDNAKYYKNKEVQAYLENSKIKLHHLPPYSPNLNPIERLWKWMKERVLYNQYYEKFIDFKSAVLDFLDKLSKEAADSELGMCFRSRIRDKFRPIKSPFTNS